MGWCDAAYMEERRAGARRKARRTGEGRLVEVQATAERDPFSRELLGELLDLAAGGVAELRTAQDEAIAWQP